MQPIGSALSPQSARIPQGRSWAATGGCSCISIVDPKADYRQPRVSSDSVALLHMLGRLWKTMGQDIPFSGRCSRCGNQSIAKPSRLDLEAKIACELCGHNGTVVEFADISVLEAILKQITEAARLVH